MPKKPLGPANVKQFVAGEFDVTRLADSIDTSCGNRAALRVSPSRCQCPTSMSRRNLLRIWKYFDDKEHDSRYHLFHRCIDVLK
jgi:hypothetical protein